MAGKRTDRIVTLLLDKHGRTFADELGVNPKRNTPSPLFQLLCLALLSSARLGAGKAMQASKALARAGWKTPQGMANTRWEQRVDVLNKNGYARYDEKTASQLADMVGHLQAKYAGDLRKLRAEADGDPNKARRLLKEFKGIGDVGADIFLREVQVAWEEYQPFADKLALKAASRLGLGNDAASLAQHVSQERFPLLVAALVRSQLAKDHEEILAQS
ncbi:hypothetical protein MHM84_00855 [Halomonas sp. McH1-25]|uniref:hypothetical protein n=1 Tax=unclassified Halomonas TaxID=2609666 RepID=UPI001EF5B6E8|nr:MULTISPECIES: hypothetical protein [unclassified Halomonas]MCG7598330.1 hypothetical protein [Halomonas sp. McH1-25]MCP1340887.1 hypothetical protein [Halomonas sp. FL8]MCP1361610.1 hypothetical protein [Halomonas sp. BBD45]